MAGTFLVAGVSAIVPQLHGTPALVAIAFLAGAGALLHPGEVQKAGAVAMGMAQQKNSQQ